MAHPGDFDGAPRHPQVGVVVDRVGGRADAIGEGQRGGEVRKLEALARSPVAPLPSGWVGHVLHDAASRRSST